MAKHAMAILAVVIIAVIFVAALYLSMGFHTAVSPVFNPTGSINLTTPKALGSIANSTPTMAKTLSGIASFFNHFFNGAKTALFKAPGTSKLTVYLTSGNQYLLGLANHTVINGSNTTLSILPGNYVFQLGYTLTSNNIARTSLYQYNMTIDNTTAIMVFKPNNTAQWLNVGNGTFSVKRTAQLLNQAG